MNASVFIVSESERRANSLRQVLLRFNYAIAETVKSCDNLAKQVQQKKPDIIIVNLRTLDSCSLENMRKALDLEPLPMIVFADESNGSWSNSMIKAGVSAFVVNGFSENRVKDVIDVAIARFYDRQAIKSEVYQLKNKLADRKIIEKAKGLLIEKYQMSEEEAYSSMRKMAMDRNQRLAESARNVIAMMEMISN